MTTTDFAFLSIAELAGLIERREVSPVDVVQASLARIDRLDSALKAFVYIDGERAVDAARAAEIDIGLGKYRGPLHGIPIAYKDLFDVAGLPTTAASRVLAGFVASRDSTFAARARAAGSICVGKLNTQEFASGTMHLFGDTRNPWDLSRTSGGSSAGSAAAVAAGMVYAAAGTDTGGSIRMPAAFCGVVGLKPTYGRVSRAGIVPLCWSMDHAGPLTRTVMDAGLVLQVVAGADDRDPSAASRPVPEYARLSRTLPTGVRIGVPTSLYFDGGDPDVIGAVHAAVQVLRQLGATVCDVDLAASRYGQAAAWTIAYSEAFAFHRANLFARRQDFGAAIVRKVATGAFLRADELVTAGQIRQRITAEFVAALRDVDVIVMPTNLYPAHVVGSTFPNQQRPLGAPPEGDLTLLTRPVSLTGLPALSLPCGFTREGLPVGLQLIGRAFDESTLLRVGHAYEQATPWHRRQPPCDAAPQPAATALALAPASPANQIVTPIVPAAPQPASPAVRVVVPDGSSAANAVAEVRIWSALAGLDFLEDADFEPIAASLGAVRESLLAAQELVVGTEPATRPAPA